MDLLVLVHRYGQILFVKHVNESKFLGKYLIYKFYLKSKLLWTATAAFFTQCWGYSTVTGLPYSGPTNCTIGSTCILINSRYHACIPTPKVQNKTTKGNY